ncbi:MAG TPA: sigma-70 family RNA polymerase sigma factor [Pirellulales bacterium]|jgi:RNA polymerase sigma-70 factor (ECF subfamily)|nr:sigma-70 family RNA polymerase sigma factor [Pirellulales bacterium]
MRKAGHERGVAVVQSPLEPDAFVRQLTECQRRLYAYIFSILPDFVAADEVLAETNVTLWRKSAEFQPGTDFAAWGMRVAYFTVLGYQKKRRRDRHIFSGDLLDEIAAEAVESLDRADDERAALRSCIEKLPGDDRQLVSLRYQTGTSVQDIAKQKSKTPGAISSALYRIRNALADCVERTLRLESSS